MRTVALVTCQNLPDWEVDDHPLWKSLKDLGIHVLHPIWNDAHFDWSQCDVVIPRTTWDYQQHADEFLQWMTHVNQVSHLLNPLSVMQWNLDKHYLQSFADHIPPTHWFAKGSTYTSEQLLALCHQYGWQRAFLKPCIAASSWGSLRFHADTQGIETAVTHLNQWLSTHDMMMQPYFSGVEKQGEVSCIFFNHQFSHAVRKVPVAGDYRVQDDYGACDYPWQPSEDVLQSCQHILNQLTHLYEAVLYARCDFLFNDQGQAHLIELELIEPSLFFRHDSSSPQRFAQAIVDYMGWKS